jgi:tRNA 2-selenouridine synthase
MTEVTLTLDNFWTLRDQLPLVDARSEGEFEQSHIPGAINIPILNNAERVQVGTLYKQAGPEKATLKGFELVGPRFHLIQREALRKFPAKKLILYCWRGGMRSQILSWLLTQVGFEVFRLEGGYKTYRSFTHACVRQTYTLLLLGGKTGTGKTVLLRALSERGEQVVDLEGLANHKGSSFGGIGQLPQPTVEQFENLFAEQLRLLDPKAPIWIEKESRRIGRIILPDQFYEQMTKSLRIEIEKTEEARIAHIAEEYASLEKEDLLQAVTRLQKKLGGFRMQQALDDIRAKQDASWIANLLGYYDKTYAYDLDCHEPGKTTLLPLHDLDLSTQLDLLLQTKNILHGTISHPTH